MLVMDISFVIAQLVITFSQHYWLPNLFFKHWWHGHVSCTVAYPSWSRMVDLPNSHGIPRVNNKYNQKSQRKKREKEKWRKKKEMWLSIWTVFFFCPHISLPMSRQHNTEVCLISRVKVHALAGFLLHAEVRSWFASALNSVFSCHHYPLSSLVSITMKSGHLTVFCMACP